MGVKGFSGTKGSRPSRHNEWQLVFFTILTQMSVGIFVLWGLVVISLPAPNPFSSGLYPGALLGSVLVFLVSGTLFAGLHLGFPWHAVFSIANLRTSWLSREAILGGVFGLISLILWLRFWSANLPTFIDFILIIVGIICGLVLVYVISRLYMLRTVPAWNHFGTPATFFATTFLLGSIVVTTIWLTLIFWDDAYAIEMVLSKVTLISNILIFLFAALQLGVFIVIMFRLNSQRGAALESAKLLWTDLRGILIWRIVTMFAALGILILKFLIWLTPFSFFLAFGLILVSEILGRFLFYGFYRREGI